MDIAPCRDCKKREVGCHAKCEDYKSWKVLRDFVIAGQRSIESNRGTDHDSQPFWRKHRKDPQRGRGQT